MKYSDFGFKVNTDYNIAKIGNAEIKVLKYLPIRNKIDLIEISLQRAQEGGRYNEMKLDMYFNLYLVFMYTDLEFSEDERANEELLYDELCCNNVIISVIGAMEDMEYDDLITYLKLTKSRNERYMRSAASLMQTFIEDMPKNAQAVADIVNNFDKEKFENVVNFAKAANGQREIPQN